MPPIKPSRFAVELAVVVGSLELVVQWEEMNIIVALSPAVAPLEFIPLTLL